MNDDDTPYVLDDQVGYILRLASQRHAGLFQEHMEHRITATQFSALMRVKEQGQVSQNQLGRLAGMDVATIKGVVDRLRAKGLAQVASDPKDKRRTLISLTEKGAELIPVLQAAGFTITADTLSPLSVAEQRTFLKLLRKLT